jgi:hypothetical protein
MADWAYDARTTTVQAHALLCCLEDYAADEKWVGLTLKELCELTRMKEKALKIAANQLARLGYLKIQPSRAGKPTQWRIVSAASCASAEEGIFTTKSLEKKPHPAREDNQPSRENRATATAIVDQWYAAMSPRPNGSPQRSTRIVASFLENGWTPLQVEAALYEVFVLTENSLEFALRKREHRSPWKPNSPASEPPRPVETYDPEEPATPEQREIARRLLEEAREQIFGGRELF